MMVRLKGQTAKVVWLLCAGERIDDIATQLGMARRTVKMHLHRAFMRAHITNRWIKCVRLVYLVSIGFVVLEVK